MRHLKRAVLVALSCVLVLVVVACSDQTAEANKAIDAANAQIQKYTKAGAALEQLMSQAEALPMDPENAKKGVDLTGQMTAKLDEQRAADSAANAEIEKVKAMKVRQEFRT